MENGFGAPDALDPDVPCPPSAGRIMALGVGRSPLVYCLGSLLCGFLLGSVSLVRLRGNFRATMPGRRAIPVELDMASGTTL